MFITKFLTITSMTVISMIFMLDNTNALPKTDVKNVIILGEHCGHKVGEYIMGCTKDYVCDDPNVFASEPLTQFNGTRVCMEYLREEDASCNALQVCINGLRCIDDKCVNVFPSE
ncbi:hypothetical protein BDF22DRAFT_687256 [Syncephalis plumigaleata]|nr:hypothetical protein BDF22DRAFT_687256 [Syncephalis plumigaleata]